MSIRPVDFNGMIQRTQDVSTLKQNEDNRPVVEQQTIFSQEMKKVEQNLHQVVHAREKENAGYRYDAKEKGNGHYEKEERKKKDKKQQKADNVYLKGQTSTQLNNLKVSKHCELGIFCNAMTFSKNFGQMKKKQKR